MANGGNKNYGEYYKFTNVGDVIAIGGDSPLSNFIKNITCSPVSHMGIICDVVQDESGHTTEAKIADSILDKHRNGVGKNELEKYLESLSVGGNTHIWWLPIRTVGHDLDKVQKKIDTFVGRPFDFFEAALALAEFGYRTRRESGLNRFQALREIAKVIKVFVEELGNNNKYLEAKKPVYEIDENAKLKEQIKALEEFLIAKEVIDENQGKSTNLLPIEDKGNYSSIFCSELLAAVFDMVGIIGVEDPSDISPIQLCRFNIFEKIEYIKGPEPIEIPGFNSLDPNI